MYVVGTLRITKKNDVEKLPKLETQIRRPNVWKMKT